MVDLIVFAILNILAFVLFGVDAFRAESGRKPLPRVILVLSAILGGGFGALCALILYKHLYRDPTFRVLVPVCAILQVLVMAYIRLFCI